MDASAYSSLHAASREAARHCRSAGCRLRYRMCVGRWWMDGWIQGQGRPSCVCACLFLACSCGVTTLLLSLWLVSFVSLPTRTP
ncbi:hypothetical protein HDV57DRAFT_494630 [Trichoderma longibrachiatum]|uniref:Uncharacterized protein n=1 Tax=Trichoderma longibrachiatum ATCC 18648 TaxID=983965 RepID=A0A2T4C5A4_TRILO|nr:hypothetical protein M440DRAFT_1232888 [Trichoderma longibrachiatum ATCC 18648]